VRAALRANCTSRTAEAPAREERRERSLTGLGVTKNARGDRLARAFELRLERQYGGVDGTRTRDLLRDRQAF
jgi:hypothetical protein